jgi:hypothetical protein
MGEAAGDAETGGGGAVSAFSAEYAYYCGGVYNRVGGAGMVSPLEIFLYRGGDRVGQVIMGRDWLYFDWFFDFGNYIAIIGMGNFYIVMAFPYNMLGTLLMALFAAIMSIGK